MENHPIPQDVTGFKFKLIGSITVKQFLYLLGFGILTTIAFMINVNFLFIKIPLMVLFSSIGAALAFLPIDGRPMDIMLVNFAKTIPAENRFIYKKRGADISSFAFLMPPKVLTHAQTMEKATTPDTTGPNQGKREILINRLRNSSFKPDEGEVAVLKNINSYFTDTSTVAAPIPIDSAHEVRTIPLATDDVAQAVQNQKKYEAIEEKAKEADRIAEEMKQAAAQNELANKTPQPEAQPSQSEEPQPNLQLSSEERTINTAPPTPDPVLAEKPNPSLAAGFPTLPDVPNVVLGIVRDPRGKSLPNILVEVVDANNLPVRAFKTSALGQFASATPLPAGTYKVSFEDPQKHHEFGTIEITLDNTIFQPLEIQSVDAREKLRRELFGGQQATA